MEKGYKYYLKLMLSFIIPLLVIVLAVVLIPRLIMYFLPFVLGYVIAMIANPAVSFLQRKISIKRKHSSALIIIVVLLLIILLIYWGISAVITFCLSVLNDIPAYLNSLTKALDQVFLRYSGFFEMLPEDMGEAVTEFRRNLTTIMTDLISSMALPTVDISVSAVKSCVSPPRNLERITPYPHCHVSSVTTFCPSASKTAISFGRSRQGFSQNFHTSCVV